MEIIINEQTGEIVEGESPIWYADKGYGEITVNGLRVRYTQYEDGNDNYDPFAYGILSDKDQHLASQLRGGNK